MSYEFPIITKLGGKVAVAEALRRTHKGRATEVSRKSINQWICRESIPGFAVIQMQELARERGIEISPGDFERVGVPGKGGRQANRHLKQKQNDTRKLDAVGFSDLSAANAGYQRQKSVLGGNPPDLLQEGSEVDGGKVFSAFGHAFKLCLGKYAGFLGAPFHKKVHRADVGKQQVNCRGLHSLDAGKAGLDTLGHFVSLNDDVLNAAMEATQRESVEGWQRKAPADRIRTMAGQMVQLQGEGVLQALLDARNMISRRNAPLAISPRQLPQYRQMSVRQWD